MERWRDGGKEKRKAKSEKCEAMSEKLEARSDKREARSEKQEREARSMVLLILQAKSKNTSTPNPCFGIMDSRGTPPMSSMINA
jgi:hypothetical protein